MRFSSKELQSLDAIEVSVMPQHLEGCDKSPFFGMVITFDFEKADGLFHFSLSLEKYNSLV